MDSRVVRAGGGKIRPVVTDTGECAQYPDIR